DRVLDDGHLARVRVGNGLFVRPVYPAGVDHQCLGPSATARQGRVGVHRTLSTAAPPPNRARRSAFVASGSSIGPAFVLALGVAYCSDMSSTRNEIRSPRRE